MSQRKADNTDFRGFAQRTLPELLEQFLEHRAMVVGHPARTAALHDMRLAGKPLRYMLEFSRPHFGEALAADLEDVKRLVTLLGRIHDCDVHVPRARRQLDILRRFNRRQTQRSTRIPTASLRAYVQSERILRTQLFAEACEVLKRWADEDLPSRVKRSLRHPTFE
jgi:CHAD domain-containing protein